MEFDRSSQATSGNIIADMRYAWGAAASRDGDYSEAAGIFQQALELAPGWAQGWMALGEAREKSGDLIGAIEAYGHAPALDPSGLLGAQLRLAALGATLAPSIAAPAYVRALFDQYAPQFETHLVGALSYCGPALLLAALERACTATGRVFHFDRGFDLGSGTGLMAQALVPRVTTFIGVDLSPKMNDLARATGFYNQLHARDITAFLSEETAASSDLVVAADVFVYMGDLAPIFAASADVLEPGGLFAFSVQCGAGLAWSLGADLRYLHSKQYLRALADAHGFEAIVLDDASTRKNAGTDMPGLVCVLARL